MGTARRHNHNLRQEMKINLTSLIIVSAFLSLFGHARVTAQTPTPDDQTQDPAQERRFEVGAQVSTLSIDDARGAQGRREAGFGGRLAYNVSDHVALEAEVNYFPRDYRLITTDFTGGRVIQGLFGVKAGIRRGRFGLFGKARPGFQSSGRAVRAAFPNGNGPDPSNRFGLEFFRATQLTADVGGVVEYYPSRRTILRVDVGDTITRYPDIQFIRFPEGVPGTEDVYMHNAQVSVGFGFRF